MLISHSKKFIFIHTPKVAGTSIKEALKEYSADFFNLSSEDEKKYLNGTWPAIFSQRNEKSHITAKMLKETISADVFNSYFKFAFVRNPYDLLVSSYFFFLNKKADLYDGFVKKYANVYDFIEKYQEIAKLEEPVYHFKLSSPQSAMLYDGNELLVDFVGKYENLEEDFRKVCKKIGIENITLPQKNIGNHNNWKDYYSKETKEQIYNILREDFERFDYPQ